MTYLAYAGSRIVQYTRQALTMGIQIKVNVQGGYEEEEVRVRTSRTGSGKRLRLGLAQDRIWEGVKVRTIAGQDHF